MSMLSKAPAPHLRNSNRSLLRSNSRSVFCCRASGVRATSTCTEWSMTRSTGTGVEWKEGGKGEQKTSRAHGVGDVDQVHAAGTARTEWVDFLGVAA